MQASQIQWGILGPGTIAKAFAHGVKQASAGKIVALGSRSAERTVSAQAFANELKLESPKIHASYDALLADDTVQAVYIATPHPFHARWAIAAAHAGKHVFVEKPAGLNLPEVMAMTEAARVNGTFFLEAFKDRCHPQLHRLVELLKEGVIGEARMMDVSFGFGGAWLEPDHRLFNKDLAGGAILDVGGYCVEYARAIAGAIADQPFADPVDVRGVGHLGETGIDEHAAATLRFESGFVAKVATGIRVQLDNTAVIYGTEGRIVVTDPWLNDRENAVTSTIEVHRNGEDPVTHTVEADYSAFGYEALAAATAIADGQTECEHMSWDDSLGQAGTLDAWRKQIGLTYPQETPEGFATPIHGRPLAKANNAPMQYGKVKGL
ncbi:MAG: Gfo/Idh/MocA family oxidoreductase, partial [Planctomycetota bacterium]